jgi:hypothetical protein
MTIMKSPYKIFLLLCLTTIIVRAQTFEVYKESFDVRNLKNLVLDFEGTYVLIEKSENNMVHFDFNIEFTNYSKKEIEAYLRNINTSSQISSQSLEFKSKTDNYLGNAVYSLETLYGISFEGNNVSFNDESNLKYRKSKQYFLSLNNTSKIESLKNYLKNLREVDNNGNKRKINPDKVKISKTKFIIKVPEHLNYQIKAQKSDINFKHDIETKITLNAKDSNLTFKNLNNPDNAFDMVNGNFYSASINGGTFTFNHVTKLNMASIENCIFNSEFSHFNIGEIGNNVKIDDFNSKFWIYNFATNFGTFKMTTEYSEINLFYPENIEYLLTTFGHNTKHYTNKLITITPPSKKNISSKMMVIGDESKNYSNKIEINAIHGIIKFGEDFIDVHN